MGTQRFLQGEESSTSVQHCEALLRGTLCSRLCSAAKVKDTGTIYRHIVMVLKLVKNPTKKPPFSCEVQMRRKQ